MCIKKVKIITFKKAKVKRVKSKVMIEFQKLAYENLKEIAKEPKIDFSGIREI